jgi:hypothetical protein
MDTENMIILIFVIIWLVGLLCCAAYLHCDCDDVNDENDQDEMKMNERVNNLPLQD